MSDKRKFREFVCEAANAQRHLSKGHAKKARDKVREKYPHLIFGTVYHCEHCRGWHFKGSR